ncbi:MAG: transketolase [Nanoarchaeota archaeon]
MPTIQQLKDIASILRKDSILATTSAGSGHPTSCLSCAEIIACLFFSEMRYDIKNPNNLNNDEFILSKGHAVPILYSALIRSGCIKANILDLRKFGSFLEGHPIPNQENPWIKAASGSLGQGLSIGAGISLASKLSERQARTYVLLGDSETTEGSIYEAAQFISHYKLNNLCAIIDINRLGQSNPTMLQHNIKAYESRFKSLGFNAISIDGHDIKQILKAFQESRKSSLPTIILAKTIKGKGVSFLEDREGWHGKALNEELALKAIKEIPNVKMPKFTIKKPAKYHFKESFSLPKKPDYGVTDLIATRKAYGNALAKLADLNENIYALDAEVSNSTFSEFVKNKTPEKFIECYIAEQNMIGVAQGLSIKGMKPFTSTFGAFLTRAHDQLRMAAISNANLTICGSHAGISIGEDGPSQMALEDISLFRSLPNSTIFYPSDAVSTEKLVFTSAKLSGIKYIRTTRSTTPLIYKNDEEFPVGDFKIIQESQKDNIVLAGAGITLHESMKAQIALKKHNIFASLIDIYCIKPFNSIKFIDFVKSHGNKLVITEDHYQEGGIGEMLSHALANTDIKIVHLCVKSLPHSGKKEELLAHYNIDSTAITSGAIALINKEESIQKELVNKIENKPKIKKKAKTKKRK